ncbi:MAG: hypothetical protein QM315_05010 [Bacillota bacterium]|nr:hypothetical protein [Bacillota bacterium]
MRIREHLKKVTHVLTPEEKRKQLIYRYFSCPVYDFLPTGELSLIIDEFRADRKAFKDSRNKKVEALIPDFYF